MARSFNGTSDKILIATGLAAPPAYTISLWVNPTSIPGTGGAYLGLTRRNGTGSIGLYSIALGGSGSVNQIAYYFNGGSGPHVDPGAGHLVVGAWAHIAATYDSTNGLKTFLNNVSDGTAAAGSACANDQTQNAFVGADPASGGSLFFNGSICDLAIWNTSLTTGNITSLFNGVRPVNVNNANLIGWWPLDGYASPETDLSGNGNTGALTGTTGSVGSPALWRISA